MAAALRLAVLAGSAGFVFWMSWLAPAWPHDSPKGWKYPFTCCSDFDCREVQKPARVGEGPEGFTVPSGELVAHGDPRIKHSPDGEFHWCTVAGKEDSRTICLFVPPRGF